MPKIKKETKEMIQKICNLMLEALDLISKEEFDEADKKWKEADKLIEEIC